MPPIRWNQPRLSALVCLALTVGTFVLYWPVSHHPFITLDDNLYVTATPQVEAGLTWSGIGWAFTNLAASNWHPLSWLSHMLDCQLFGLNAGGHHLTSVFFHIGNTLLLFFWLKGVTGALWRSAMVAALFAWHPLHVESVAWVAERKDVLSTFFWLLALLAYTRYVKRPGISAYLLVFFLFACGLMAKPMVVTLPFVLLLVDYWPLNRLSPADISMRTAGRLALEKLPFLILAVAVSGVNYIAQKGGGATWSPDALPLYTRTANALVSCVRYLSKNFWPSDLAVIYPYQKHWPLWFVLAAAALMLFWSGTVVLRAHKNPYLFFGWFYFIGTLVPVIGLVQVGPQAMADRYMYLPSIGLFVLVVWGLHELLAAQSRRYAMTACLAIASLSACMVITSLQLRHWQSSVKLLLHTVEVTTDNYTANAYLGGALEVAGCPDEALPFYRESVRITPHFPIAQWSLGMALLRRGQAAEASEHLAVASQLTPGDPVIRCYSGKAFADAGSWSAADAQFAEALRLKPDYAEAHFFSAIAWARQKNFAAAIPHFSEAVRLAPTNPNMHYGYGLALLDNRQPKEAAVQFSEALRLDPQLPDARHRLNQLLAEHPELKDPGH